MLSLCGTSAISFSCQHPNTDTCQAGHIVCLPAATAAACSVQPLSSGALRVAHIQQPQHVQ